MMMIALFRVAGALALPLWHMVIRWPLNPQGARLFWLLFLIGWRTRRDLWRSARMG